MQLDKSGKKSLREKEAAKKRFGGHPPMHFSVIYKCMYSCFISNQLFCSKLLTQNFQIKQFYNENFSYFNFMYTNSVMQLVIRHVLVMYASCEYMCMKTTIPNS